MTAILAVFSAYALLLLTWVLYLAIMNLAAHQHRLHPVAKFHAYFIILPVGYVFDAALNLLVCAVFLRIPQDWLLTGTLKRTINVEPSGSWRCVTASWMCEHLLNQFDPKGSHC